MGRRTRHAGGTNFNDFRHQTLAYDERERQMKVHEQLRSQGKKAIRLPSRESEDRASVMMYKKTIDMDHSARYALTRREAGKPPRRQAWDEPNVPEGWDGWKVFALLRKQLRGVGPASSFRVFDINNAGCFSGSQLKEGLARMHIKVSDDQVAQVMSCLDLDRDGLVDINDFVYAVQNSRDRDPATGPSPDFYRTNGWHTRTIGESEGGHESSRAASCVSLDSPAPQSPQTGRPVSSRRPHSARAALQTTAGSRNHSGTSPDVTAIDAVVYDEPPFLAGHHSLPDESHSARAPRKTGRKTTKAKKRPPETVYSKEGTPRADQGRVFDVRREKNSVVDGDTGTGTGAGGGGKSSRIRGARDGGDGGGGSERSGWIAADRPRPRGTAAWMATPITAQHPPATMTRIDNGNVVRPPKDTPAFATSRQLYGYELCSPPSVPRQAGASGPRPSSEGGSSQRTGFCQVETAWMAEEDQKKQQTKLREAHRLERIRRHQEDILHNLYENAVKEEKVLESRRTSRMHQEMRYLEGIKTSHTHRTTTNKRLFTDVRNVQRSTFHLD
eukprot:Rmarinus@m.18586